LALRSFADGFLFAEAFGEGNPQVLALHGWGRRGADFKQSLGEIPALAPDFPGFGASPAPKDVIGAEGYAKEISVVLDEYDRPPLVVGHSFGGRVAVCLAARWPERVGPLLLTGVPLVRLHPGRKPPFTYRILRALHRIGLVPDSKMEQIRQERGSADYRAASGIMRDILVKVINESYEDQLRQLRSEVHLLWGDRDAEVPVPVARLAADIIGQAGNTTAQVEVVSGVGHHLPIEAPDELRRVVDSMLR
jgi:pimeloyl-ACP methyl ester carboxylesterase